MCCKDVDRINKEKLKNKEHRINSVQTILAYCDEYSNNIESEIGWMIGKCDEVWIMDNENYDVEINFANKHFKAVEYKNEENGIG